METIKDKIKVIFDELELDYPNTIKEIEKLILQEKIDMLEKFAPEIKDKKYTNPFIYQDVIKLYSELTTELNLLQS